MAKGQMRGNREAKKPKKKREAAAVPVISARIMPAAFELASKKKKKT